MSTHPEPRHGLTFRSVVVTLAALLLMGIWVEYEELYNTYGGPLAENSPPNSAVGVILLVMGIGAGLYRLRRGLRLSSRELVVVYSALVLAAPLMTQGMWHRMFGLIAAIPHNQDFRSYESLPPMLWPHGPNLIKAGRFTGAAGEYAVAGTGTVEWTEIDRGTRGTWRSPVLVNPAADPDAETVLRCEVARFGHDGRERLVPGENHLVSVLVRGEGLTRQSSYFIRIRPDDGPEHVVLSGSEAAAPSFSEPGGFRRVGACPVAVPVGLRSNLTVSVGLSGPGRLAVQDLQFMNVEAIESAYAGRGLVSAGRLPLLPDGERNSLDVRPDRLLSPAGLAYLLKGRIPLTQWVQPALAWGALVASLFMGFLGLNIIMRRQWSEHERFTFPLTIVPQNLLTTASDGVGRVIHPALRSRPLWLGFAVALPLVLLKGIQFYFPNVPAPVLSGSTFDTYVTSPVLKAYLSGIGIGVGQGFGLSFTLLAIAMLIETDILFSLWSMFLLFRFWHLLGALFGLNRHAGYPWDHQQSMGGFITYAVLALVVARQHLAHVFRLITGRERGHHARHYRAALLMVLASLGGLLLWGIWTSMGMLASLLFFGYMLTCGFAASKIRAECGAPYGYLTPYYGMQFVAAVGGFAVFRSTGMLVATIAAGFMCTSCFLLIAPAQVEMLELGRRFGIRTRDIGGGLILGLLGGLLIGGFVLLGWAYGFGANNLRTSWPYEQNWYFDGFRSGERQADRAVLAGPGVLEAQSRPLDVVNNPDARGLAVGAVATTGLALLRSRFAGFPFHPMAYVLAPSNFMTSCWFILFLAWLARVLVLRIGGARMVRHGLIPFCIGMFLACIAAIVIFDVVGILLRIGGRADVYSLIP